MKHFTDSDLRPFASDSPLKDCFSINTNGREDLLDDPLDWQKRGLQQTASGYGRKLVMREKISFNGKFYRLYCTCFSNSGSVWFKAKGKTIYVH